MFVPGAFQSGATDSVNAEYHKNEVRIQNVTAAATRQKNTFLEASGKSSISKKTAEMVSTPAVVEQGSFGSFAMLCVLVIGGAVGVFFATRKAQHPAESEGYTSLLA